jgi:hypothetical protein
MPDFMTTGDMESKGVKDGVSWLDMEWEESVILIGMEWLRDNKPH